MADKTRTTVELDADLHRDAKIHAAAERKSLNEVIEEALEKHLPRSKYRRLSNAQNPTRGEKPEEAKP